MKLRAPLAALIAALLVTGLAGVFVVEKPAAARPQRRATDPEAARVDRAVRDIARFVEVSRGLKFTRPVRAALLDDAAFKRRLVGDPPERDADALGISRTLGLVDPSLSDDAAVGGDAVDGFYDFGTKRLYVRGQTLTPYVRYVLAHELTHALQDQHFRTSRLSRLGDADESDIGLITLMEGDAMRVADAYYASLPVDDQKAIDAVHSPERVGTTTTTTTAPTPPVPTWPGERGMTYADVFPYALGPVLVERLVEKGGQAALDAAFAYPPNSSEQLVFTGDTKINEQPSAVATPAADGPVIDEGPMGVYAVNTLLYSQWTNVYWDSSQWSGGRYVAWRRGGDVCVRFTVHMDTGYAASMLVSNLDLVAAFHGGATVTGPIFPQPVIPYDQIRNGPVTYTACGAPKTRTWEQAQAVIGARLNRDYAKSHRSGGYAGPPPTYRAQPYQPLPRVTWLIRLP